MTVGEEVNGKLECHWFNHKDGEWTLKEERFPPDLLKSVALSK